MPAITVTADRRKGSRKKRQPAKDTICRWKNPASDNTQMK